MRVFRIDHGGKFVAHAEVRADDLASPVRLGTGLVRGQLFATRAGVFQYTLPNGDVRSELRHPDDVFDLESIASLRMVPVCHEHPGHENSVARDLGADGKPIDVQKGQVTIDNVNILAKGWIGSEVTVEDGHLKTDAVLSDKRLINAVLVDKLDEVSSGYWCEVEEEIGEYEGIPYTHRQKNIRYNHVALGLTDPGRAGPTVRFKADSNKKKKEPTMATRKISLASFFPVGRFDSTKVKGMPSIVVPRLDMDIQEEQAGSVEAALGQIKEIVDSLMSMLGQAQGDAEAAEEVMAEQVTKADAIQQKADSLQAKVDELEAKRLDGKELTELVRKRSAILTVANQILKADAKVDELSNIELQKAVVLAVRQDADLKGKSDDYVVARYDSIVEDLEKNPIEPETRNDSVVMVDDEDDDAIARFDSVGARNRRRQSFREMQPLAFSSRAKG